MYKTQPMTLLVGIDFVLPATVLRSSRALSAKADLQGKLRFARAAAAVAALASEITTGNALVGKISERFAAHRPRHAVLQKCLTQTQTRLPKKATTSSISGPCTKPFNKEKRATDHIGTSDNRQVRA
jgi:hypothetical protein